MTDMTDYNPDCHEVANGIDSEGARCYGCGRLAINYYTLRNRVTTYTDAIACLWCAIDHSWPVRHQGDMRQRDMVGVR